MLLRFQRFLRAFDYASGRISDQACAWTHGVWPKVVQAYLAFQTFLGFVLYGWDMRTTHPEIRINDTLTIGSGPVEASSHFHRPHYHSSCQEVEVEAENGAGISDVVELSAQSLREDDGRGSELAASLLAAW